jgi:hypothetical protein
MLVTVIARRAWPLTWIREYARTGGPIVCQGAWAGRAELGPGGSEAWALAA